MSVLSLQDRMKKPEIKKSKFGLNHVHNTTGQLGRLYPVLCEEVLPNDYWKCRASHIINFMPLAGKVQTRCDLYLHWFFVPTRVMHNSLIPENGTISKFENIITGRSEQGFVVKDLYNMTLDENAIGQYLGLPQTTFNAHLEVSKYPLWGYIQIYNDYYRNKVLQAKLADGDLDYYDPPLLRNWRKDYFTSAMAYPQFGDPSRVEIDINYFDQSRAWSDGNPPSAGNIKIDEYGGLTDGSDAAINIDNVEEAGVDVNDIRFAYAYQDWLVRMLQSGDDYGEHLKMVFGVEVQDKRLQRAEYLGGYTKPVIINDVTQMAPAYDSADELISPLGTQGGAGYSFGDGDEVSFFAEEHGFIYCILSILPKSQYAGGVPKKFLRYYPLDLFYPQFAYLPEQEILKMEVAETGDQDTNEETFGYIERYAEYKHINDKTSGEMVKQLKQLNFARIFNSEQVLDEDFLKANIREDAFAVQGDIHWYGQFGFDIEAERPMPFNVDGLTL